MSEIGVCMHNTDIAAVDS